MNRWAKWSSAGTANVLLASSGRALACHEDPTPPPDRYDNVVSVGLVIGGISFTPKVRLVYGIDLRFGHGPVAALLRVEGRGSSSARVVAGVQAMSGHGSGELGLVLQTGIRAKEIGPSLGIHLGVGTNNRGSGITAQGTMPFLWDRRNYDLSLAAIVVPQASTFDFCLPAGRPLRHGSAVLLPDVGAAPHAFCESAERAALATSWIEDARAEYASVWAFHRVAAELNAAGAPKALVREALHAAGDEENHARLCAGLAGNAFWLHPLAPDACRPRWNKPSNDATIALAREAWVDGCVGEGISAARAARASEESKHPAAVTAQATIGRDERRHAELGWNILTWAWRTGGVAARDAITEITVGRPPQQDASQDKSGDTSGDGDGQVDLDWLMAHGRLRADIARTVAEDETTRACDRLRRLTDSV